MYANNEELNLENKQWDCVFSFDRRWQAMKKMIFSMEVFVVGCVEKDGRIFDNIMIDNVEVMKNSFDTDHVCEEQQSF